MQHLKQHHRIHPARDGHKDFLTARKQAAGQYPAFNTLEKFAHAVILLFSPPPGKQPVISVGQAFQPAGSGNFPVAR
jgi:hypothetical protein